MRTCVTKTKGDFRGQVNLEETRLVLATREKCRRRCPTHASGKFGMHKSVGMNFFLPSLNLPLFGFAALKKPHSYMLWLISINDLRLFNLKSRYIKSVTHHLIHRF